MCIRDRRKDIDSLNTLQRLQLLKKQLWAVKYFMAKMQEETASESSRDIVTPVSPETTTQPSRKLPMVVRKKFKVNIEMLKRREGMSERVILERRYNIIKGKPA
eukprot:TRINITY_DN21188_c0_g1_i2.p2 TRINITY_DN21188_c0_g1~~TRINITY_DN21188_c0_g1_i2.p2  ORF type:complete len:104 (-),score=26.84 TRINITY_DN21188_c0_g1_i2:34-345(-)